MALVGVERKALVSEPERSLFLRDFDFSFFIIEVYAS